MGPELNSVGGECDNGDKTVKRLGWGILVLVSDRWGGYGSSYCGEVTVEGLDAPSVEKEHGRGEEPGSRV